ncbi:MAG: hypothetical protein ABI462_00365 [Ignavibacteria bacterium]
MSALLFVFISLSVLIPLYFILFSCNVNGKPGFPFDDSFIHLTFAKNIYGFFSFSYYKDLMVTSGSSSTLFTFMLASCFGLIKNEFLLGYLPGITFFAILIFFFYKISLKEFRSNFYFMIVMVLILSLDKWMIFFAASGMETTLFACVLVASAHFYREKKLTCLSISLSMIIWIRLEGIIFIGAILADQFFSIMFNKDFIRDNCITKKNFRKCVAMSAPVIISISAYMLMNLYLSGTLFPNTFYAKKIFYSPEFMSRDYFLTTEVPGLFINGSYKILLPGFIFSLIILSVDLFKKKKNSNFPYFIFIFLFIFAYCYEMPYAGQMGRYLIPLVPFYIIISVSGLFRLFICINKYYKQESVINFAFYFLFLLMFYYCGKDLQNNLFLYSKECDYIEQSHIKPAKWIFKNSMPGDIVATHEIGAVGFYSDRKIIDIAGLVTPELIDKLSDENYVGLMQQYLNKNNVKYFATLSNWCKVVNANPVYSGNIDAPGYESFDVYKYTPDSDNGIHFLSKEVNRLLTSASYNLKNNSPGKAIDLLNKAIELDPKCSLSFYLKAEASLKNRDMKNFESYLRKAVELFPDYETAKMKLTEYFKPENKTSGSKKIISSQNTRINDPQNF